MNFVYIEEFCQYCNYTDSFKMKNGSCTMRNASVTKISVNRQIFLLKFPFTGIHSFLITVKKSSFLFLERVLIRNVNIKNIYFEVYVYINF